MARIGRLEAILWSIALPGFAQLLNRKFAKGLLLIVIEYFVNFLGNLNTAIVLSFHGQIEEAIQQTDYAWLMFYPCLYFFAMWDALKDAKGRKDRYAFVPFVFGAYIVTIGLIYSPTLKIFGVLIGPVFLPILFMIPGIGIGLLIKYILEVRRKARHEEENLT